MKPLGTQHIAEFIKCKKDLLDDPAALRNILLKGIREAGLHHKKIISHRFNPLGVTVLAIICESHIGLHTYPEAGQISLDIFTCSDSQKQMKLLKNLRKKFKPRTVRIAEIQRGNPIELMSPNWITSKSEYGFEVRYLQKKKIYSKKSKFQLIEIIENESFGRMLFLDKDLQIAESDAHIYNHSLVDPIRQAKKKINNSLILGGGDGGILLELLMLNPKSVTLIDIDKQVIKASKKHLASICKGAFDNPRVKIITGDAFNFLENEQKFDVIVYDLTMHPEAFTRMKREDFLDNVFLKIRNNLSKKGIITLQCGSENDSQTLKLVKKILKCHFVKVKFYTSYIPSFCENWVFAYARIK